MRINIQAIKNKAYEKTRVQQEKKRKWGMFNWMQPGGRSDRARAEPGLGTREQGRVVPIDIFLDHAPG